MKCWIVGIQDEWCSLVHIETRGKARAWAARMYDQEFVDLYARRLPELDNKPITHGNAKAAGFEYEDESWGGFIKPEEFINDCRCEICKTINI